MKHRTSVLLALSVAATAVSPGMTQTEGKIMSSEQVPTSVPEPLRQARYERPYLPTGWNAVIPFGIAITTSGGGTLEISAFKLLCYVPGNSEKQTVISDLQSVGGALHLLDPWFGNDNYSESATISRTSDGTVIFNIPPNRVLHWWANRTTIPEGTNNCSTEAVVRGTGKAIAAVGADWWKTNTAQWAGTSVNNQEIGSGNWYDLSNGEWQVIRMEPILESQTK